MIQFWVKRCCKIIVEYSSWNKSRVRVWLSTHNVFGQRRESHSVGSMSRSWDSRIHLRPQSKRKKKWLVFYIFLKYWLFLKIILTCKIWGCKRMLALLGLKAVSIAVYCQCQMLPAWQQRFSFTQCRILKTSLVGSWIKKTTTKYLCIILSTCRLEISSLDIFFMGNNVLSFLKMIQHKKNGR